MASYNFTGDFELHVTDMLNALSIQYAHKDYTVFTCIAVDDPTSHLSTFHIELKTHTIHITRTDHEFDAYQNQLIKISKYLECNNIEFVIPPPIINHKSSYVYTKEDSIKLLNYIDMTGYDAFDGEYKCKIAFTMMHYLMTVASNSPTKPYFTDDCPYFTHITEWVYNRNDLEVNLYLRINYVTQIILSLKFIYAVAHIPYVDPKWITHIIPFVIIKMKSEDQHIQRTALMVAVYLYREKNINIFKSVTVTLVSGDIAAKMYLNELK